MMIMRLILVVAVFAGVLTGIACVNDPTLDQRTMTSTSTDTGTAE